MVGAPSKMKGVGTFLVQWGVDREIILLDTVFQIRHHETEKVHCRQKKLLKFV